MEMLQQISNSSQDVLREKLRQTGMDIGESSDVTTTTTTTTVLFCEVSAKPTVSGTLRNGQLKLDAGCKRPLRSPASVQQCLADTWFVIVGGSNSILFSIQLANTLKPKTLHPTTTKSRTGDAKIVDVVYENGDVIYLKWWTDVDLSLAWTDIDFDQRKAEFKAAFAAAPAHAPGRTRVTSVVGQYWPNVDSVVEQLDADTAWASAGIALTTQIMQWYLVCGVYNIFFCNRPDLKGVGSAKTQEVFEQEAIVSTDKLLTFCGPGGRAHSRGCSIQSNSFDPGQAAILSGFNAIIGKVMQTRASEDLVFLDTWTLGSVAGGESINAHSSPVITLLNVQTALAHVCDGRSNITGAVADWTGTCFAHQTNGAMNTCPEYRNTCGANCERWECMHGPTCTLNVGNGEGGSKWKVQLGEVANVSDLIEVMLQTWLTCSEKQPAIKVDWYAAGYTDPPPERECANRITCVMSLEVILPLVAVLLVIVVVVRNWHQKRQKAEKLIPPKPSIEASPPAPPERVGHDIEGQLATAEGSPAGDVSVQKTELPGSVGEVPAAWDPSPTSTSRMIVQEEPTDAPKMKEKADHFPLGLARFLASLHVVAGHLYSRGSTAKVWFFGFGFTWVPWFFMLSGFVLFSANARRPTKENPLEYAFRRSVTIYPLYAISLIPAFFLAWAQGRAPHAGVIVSQIWLLQSWIPPFVEHTLQMHCWFLSCMVAYWLAFKPVANGISKLGMAQTVGAMLAICVIPWIATVVGPAGAGNVEWYKDHTFRNMETSVDVLVVIMKFNPLCYFHVFLMGCLLAHLRLLLGERPASKMRIFMMEVLAPWAYVMLVAIFGVKDLKPWGYKLSARLSILLPLQAAILLGFSGIPGDAKPLVGKIAAQIDFLSDYSYAIYIFQFICHDLWPTGGVASIGYWMFLIAVAYLAQHFVQQPAQQLWKKLSLKYFWLVPLALSVLLGGMSFVPDPSWKYSSELVTPPDVDQDGEMLDIRLQLDGANLSPDEELINPSLFVIGNDVVVAARRHRISSRQFNGETEFGDGTIIESVWHSDVVVGRTSLDPSWWETGFGPLSVKTWELQSLSGGHWNELCAQETWIPENSTLMRKVVTGPEDPKPIQLSSGDVAVAFSSLPPLGYHGCEPGGDVSQMYLAASVNPLQPDDVTLGRRLTCGFTRRPEKNWVPFLRRGHLHFAYTIVPHEIVAARDNGDCETVYTSDFRPLSKLLEDNPSYRARGSGQAVLIDGEALAQTSMSTPHFLALMHLFDVDKGAYSHFAYRFSAEPPYEILQVSQQLPLKPATSPQSLKTFAFASGLAMHVDTDSGSTHRIVVSYGAGDRDARALIMPLTRFDEYFASCSL